MHKDTPLWKWALLLILAIVLGFIGMLLLKVWNDSVDGIALLLLGPVAWLAVYYGGVRLIERRPAKDLPLRRLAPDIGLGLLTGILFISCVVGLLVAFGYAHLVPREDTWKAQLLSFCLCLGTAVGEEVLFRGILFRWIDERSGVIPALVVSGLVFGFLHLGNPGATVWSSVAIAIEAGLLLGAAYKWSGTLWLPIGIHWSWNYVQGSIYGIAVSGGSRPHSLYDTVMEGPDLITGGAFGVEASVISVALGAILSAFFLYLRFRKRDSD